MMRTNAGKSTGLVLLAFIALVFTVLLSVAPVTEAHGKELTLDVSSFPLDDDSPLTRLFRVRVLYAGDLEPVDDATVRLTAVRQGGGPETHEVMLQPLNEPGVYAAEASFPLFGSWNVTINVDDVGQGEVTYVEDLLPSLPDQGFDEGRQKVLSLFFRFDWKDAVAILVRVSHAFAATVWFGLTGLILASFWIMSDPSRPSFFRRMLKVFGPASYTALALMLLTGAYTAAYSAPINPPGVFDFDVMWSVPFGPQYMGAIGFKVVALAVYGFIAVQMSRSLAVAAYPPVAGGSTSLADGAMDVSIANGALAAERTLLRLSLANAVLGMLLAVTITVAIYLHYISHLAVFVPN